MSARPIQATAQVGGDRWPATVEQPGHGHAPGLADGGRTSWQRHGGQVAYPLASDQIGNGEFASPQRVVRPVAQPVEGDAQHRSGAAVVDQARGDVGVVVLYGNRGQVELGGQFGREVLRVEIVGHHLGCHPAEVADVADGLEEGAVGGQVLQVAQVMTGYHRGPLDHRHRALQLGPQGQYGTSAAGGKVDGLGGIAAGSAENLGHIAAGPNDRVVAADVDGPIVGHDAVHHRAQSIDGVVVGIGDRLVGQVATGHDHGTAHCGQQHVMERRVGQHHSQFGQPRRHIGGHGTRCSPGREHDRTARRGQQRHADIGQLDEPPSTVRVGSHHGKGLVVAGLASPKLGDGLG